MTLGICQQKSKNQPKKTSKYPWPHDMFPHVPWSNAFFFLIFLSLMARTHPQPGKQNTGNHDLLFPLDQAKVSYLSTCDPRNLSLQQESTTNRIHLANTHCPMIFLFPCEEVIGLQKTYQQKTKPQQVFRGYPCHSIFFDFLKRGPPIVPGRSFLQLAR